MLSLFPFILPSTLSLFLSLSLSLSLSSCVPWSVVASMSEIYDPMEKVLAWCEGRGEESPWIDRDNRHSLGMARRRRRRRGTRTAAAAAAKYSQE